VQRTNVILTSEDKSLIFKSNIDFEPTILWSIPKILCTSFLYLLFRWRFVRYQSLSGQKKNSRIRVHNLLLPRKSNELFLVLETYPRPHMCSHHRLMFCRDISETKKIDQIRPNLRIGDKSICDLEPLALDVFISCK